MSKQIRFASEACELARLATLSVIAVGVASYALAHASLPTPTFLLAALMVGVGAAMVIQVQRAVSRLLGQSRSVKHSASEAEKHYIEVLGRIVKVVESRDRYWAGHSRNVARLTRLIAEEMSLPSEQCDQLVMAAELHDIGLLAVPESIILSHARFGVDQFRSVQAHSAISYEVLKPLEILGEVLPAIRSHHEKLNGTGYPDGLKGEEIPLGGRILAVADAYDAMTHDRPHRQAMTPLRALRELRRCTPAGFDPACVEALATKLNIPAIEDAYVEPQPAQPQPA